MSHTLPFNVPKILSCLGCPSEIVLRDLHNPRGLRVKENGDLLLVEAGTGDAEQPFSGRLLQFSPGADGAYQTAVVLASGFRSMNMQARMCRDEIFGLADIACGAGRWLLSQTDYVTGSRIMDVTASPPNTVVQSRGNLNALCYHPQRRSWLTVKPDTNQVIEFTKDQTETVLGVLPDLPGGQHAVPVSVVLDQSTLSEKNTSSQPVLVSLFSGELQGDAGKTGIHFQKGVGKVVRINPDSGCITPVIEGLTLPTGLAFTAHGQLLVLELCRDFCQPMPPDHVPDQAWHGGFQRFSGRLLCVDLRQGTILSLVEQLDTPSNLCVAGNTVLISEGMGLPGRPIPAANGEARPLQGFVRKLVLPAF